MLHRNSMAHKDLSCENILIDKSYRFLLHDFAGVEIFAVRKPDVSKNDAINLCDEIPKQHETVSNEEPQLDALDIGPEEDASPMITLSPCAEEVKGAKHAPSLSTLSMLHLYPDLLSKIGDFDQINDEKNTPKKTEIYADVEKPQTIQPYVLNNSAKKEKSSFITNVWCGKDPYMSPECYACRVNKVKNVPKYFDALSNDVWSFGVILLLVFGESAFLWMKPDGNFDPNFPFILSNLEDELRSVFHLPKNYATKSKKKKKSLRNEWVEGKLGLLLYFFYCCDFAELLLTIFVPEENRPTMEMVMEHPFFQHVDNMQSNESKTPFIQPQFANKSRKSNEKSVVEPVHGICFSNEIFVAQHKIFFFVVKTEFKSIFAYHLYL
ncbi:hypothetical protein RFI_15920 [Reticulomyxa filosa]|uniref:non-specific serine/threonine protein kinase n=1 Tax=Reticulomyxa filosa TaxID=46433 RepID=X6N7J5_RETFI|nr:hypothetical protein RFI_15920 [Reticulomyxa filosa]|eukprot:ETO21282.1 hypothetical protein RFI_15920 [Reticulomyxa filosa]